jgi:phosphoribosylformylglycinamidine (FGAM) synthase-like enzyme
MTAYEIMLSESQERMLLVAEKGREEEVFRVFRKWGLEAVTIGKVTDDGKLRVRITAKSPPRFPTANWPTKRRSTIGQSPRPPPRPPRPPLASARSAGPPSHAAASFRHLLQALDLGAVRLSGPHQHHRRPRAPTPPSCASKKPARRSPCRSMATAATATSRRAKAPCWRWPNAAAIWPRAGARPVAATNCLNFGNPERPEIMAQLVEAIEGIAEACRFFETPITGGNVSLYNETLGEGIYPTPVIGMVGHAEDGRAGDQEFQEPGRR